MMHTILICGYGPAVGHAMALKFGLQGHPVALIARNEQRLVHAVAELQALGITAQAFNADIANKQHLLQAINSARSAMGPIGIVHWNAFVDQNGDLLSIAINDLRRALDVRVNHYLLTIQTLISDLQSTQGAVIATNGVMADYGPTVDAFAKDFGILAIPAAAQHKATGLLQQTLALQGIFVGEIIVNGFIQGSQGAADQGLEGTIKPSTIAEQFWQLISRRHSNLIRLDSTAQ